MKFLYSLFCLSVGTAYGVMMICRKLFRRS